MKTRKRKTAVIILLLLVLMLVLSGCGSSGTAASSDNTSEPGAAATEPEAAQQSAETPQAEEAETADATEGVSGRLKMTLNGTEVVYAELTDTPATAEFLEQLPFTVEMHEHLDRQKEVYLPFALSEECQQNTVHEYEIGDIVYWHPGPTMGIFTEHDGNSINSGVEVLARMDDAGVAAFQAYDAEVEVLFELEGDGASGAETAQGSRQLTITLDDTDVIYADLLDTPAANAFAEHLPLTFDMTDYANREKHAPLDFSIDDSDLENIQYPYEIGDIIYYPPGPTFAMYYDHDGREISAGMEVIANLDQAGIETLGSYADSVKVTVALSD